MIKSVFLFNRFDLIRLLTLPNRMKSVFTLSSLSLSAFVFFAAFNLSFADAKPHSFTYDYLYLQGGTYTHTRDSPDYDGPNLMLGLEAVKNNNEIFGLLLFDNSFGQFSQYLYMGKKWDFTGPFDHFHARLSAGIMHGYKEPWDNKLPFTSRNGWTPGVLPSVGYQKGKFGFDVMLLGYQGIMFSVGSKL